MVVRQNPKRAVGILMAAVVVTAGYALARRLVWYGDDIFISLRYAENFVNGHGLVYNVGERVDGFTHFLWLAVLILCRKLGADPLAASLELGLLSFAGVLALFAFVSYRMERGSLPVVLPFTALALVANHEVRVWATGGLETAFFTLLLSAAFIVAFFSRAPRTMRFLGAGSFLALAVLTRPDGFLFWGTALGFVAVRAAAGPARGEGLRDLALFVLPFLLTVVPYQAWRTAYYGDFFPNTYYAKSGGLSYYSQGFYFLWLYFRVHPTSLLFLAAVPVLARLFAAPSGKAAGPRWAAPFRDRSAAAAFVALVSVVVYLVFFVARVGGGFMYARFIVPVLPFAYFLAEWSLRRLAGRRGAAALVLCLAVPVVAGTLETAWRNDLLLEPGTERRRPRDLRGILDEHVYYTQWYPLELGRRAGTLLRPYVSDLDLTVLLRGQACFGYYAGFRTCIENAGLTDRRIARLPLESRRRIGHEKSASYEYMLERGVNFVFNRSHYREAGYRTAAFALPGLQPKAEIITYDARVMEELSRRMGSMITFMRFDRLLDRYIEEVLPVRPRELLEKDYREFREYYFDHTPDPARRRAFEEALSPE